jgi:mono/diheme cytochrome c family protein
MHITLLRVWMLAAVMLTTAQSGLAHEEAPSSSSPEATAIARGRELYMALGCYACHGTVGQGAAGTAPKLAPGTLPVQALIALVRNPPSQMPPYSPKVLSDAGLRDIHTFLSSMKD